METQTVEDAKERRDDKRAVPGLVVVHSGERPRLHVFPFQDGAVEIGRDELAAANIVDARVSRRHVRVELRDGVAGVRDQGSRNGTWADGQPVSGSHERAARVVVRIGHTLLLPVDDVGPYEVPGISVNGGVVMGPALAAVHERITVLGKSGANLLLRGATGSGKELAARAFHAAAGDAATRPFVALNCATIPRELAERILFGARRGAFTGAAADAEGIVQSAHGGTLFLDEIAELDAAVQAKLLRVLETHELLPLGALRPVRVDVRLCAATHKDLRGEVTAGRFREDLFFRIGRPEVRLAPLAERREEIPWLAHEAAARAAKGVLPGAGFVEACLLRSWPGNVRELLAEVRAAAITAAADGRAVLDASDLDETAGLALHVEPEDEASPKAAAIEATDVDAALRAERGNVVRAASRLGISRARMRRLIERHGIDADAMRRG
ncbi:MAG: sigma 54-interacting transcriptional regulator [Polyangiaceae bacterium]